MELERSGAVEIVDKDSSQTLSAVSQRSVDIKIIPTIVTETKKDLKLKLGQRLEKCSIDDDEKTSRPDIKSPKSPRTPMSPKSPLSNSSKLYCSLLKFYFQGNLHFTCAPIIRLKSIKYFLSNIDR